ncbi:hypothetical protein Pfo_024523 [Paulownia fortunei]|nr:hypothetical protein Pfo_024523 [Paulownia fortunei]
MSDKQKGSMDAIGKLLPDAEHRFCVMYLYSNFKLSHRGLQLKDWLWRAASTSQIVDFNATMDELKRLHGTAFQLTAYFSTLSKCDILLNNLCESFKRNISKFRDKLTTAMLEMVRVRLMKRIHQQRDLFKRKKKKKSAMFCSVELNEHDQFEVIGSFQERLIVQLDEWTYSCRKWDPSAPYKHIQLKAYSHLINLVHGPEVWPKTVRSPMHPLLVEKLPGRPKKAIKNNQVKHLQERVKKKNC